MDDDDRPRPSGPDARFGAAALLAAESLDSYSRDELDVRAALLEAEITRVRAHRERSDAHMQAADALFGRKAP
jgi:uncharacterized small protein (DUF1192 family)